MNWSHRNFVRALGVLGAVGVGWGVNAHDEPPRGEAASPTKIEVDESGPLEREFLAGPVKVVLRVGRREIRVAERFEVELEAHTDRDHDLVWPPPPAQLDELRVVSVRDESPERQADGSLVLRRRISLEPFLDGIYTIAPMSVTCTPLNSPEGTPTLVSTEPIPVRVVSNLSDAERKDVSKAGVENIRPILPVPGEPGRGWWWLGVSGVVVGVIGVASGVWISRRGRASRSNMLEAALPRVRAIRGAIEADQASWSHVDELVSVTRLCLVERCDSRAASMTTDELRRACSTWSALPSSEAHRLVDALAACDEARFAGAVTIASLQTPATVIERVMERLRLSVPPTASTDAAGGTSPEPPTSAAQRTGESS